MMCTGIFINVEVGLLICQRKKKKTKDQEKNISADWSCGIRNLNWPETPWITQDGEAWSAMLNVSLSFLSLQCPRHMRLARDFHVCQSFTVFLTASSLSPLFTIIYFMGCPMLFLSCVVHRCSWQIFVCHFSQCGQSIATSSIQSSKYSLWRLGTLPSVLHATHSTWSTPPAWVFNWHWTSASFSFFSSHYFIIFRRLHR